MSDQQEIYYGPGIAALALNFSEQIVDSYEPSDTQLDKLFLKAMEILGYGDLSKEKLDRSIEYYLTKSDIDIYSLPEYEIELPDLSV